MTNVVNFKRKTERLNDQAIEHIKNDENTYQVFISMPSDPESEDPVLVMSNFSPGMKELMAIESIQNYLLSQVFPVEETIE